MSFLDKDSVLKSKFLQSKDIVQVCKETLHKDISLPVTPAVIDVSRNADALRFLYLQVVCKPDHRDSSTYIIDMKVLIKSLRCTEAIGVACTKVYVLCRIEPEVSSRTEYHLLNEIMLVKTTTYEQSPSRILPFVLSVCTHDSDGLVCNPVISPHIILKVIFVIFKADRKV